MLASTVQFSNNDQPPVTHRQRQRFTGAGISEGVSFPQTPNSVPGQSRSEDHAFHALTSSTSSLRPQVPAE
jgi:hypothetical protein